MVYTIQQTASEHTKIIAVGSVTHCEDVLIFYLKAVKSIAFSRSAQGVNLLLKSKENRWELEQRSTLMSWFFVVVLLTTYLIPFYFEIVMLGFRTIHLWTPFPLSLSKFLWKKKKKKMCSMAFHYGWVGWRKTPTPFSGKGWCRKEIELGVL